MNCNVNRQQVLSLFDTLHDKYQFQDGEYKEFVETLAGKNVDDEDEDELPDWDEIVSGTFLERRRADEDEDDSDSYSDSDSECTGRFAPIDPVLAEKMNHSETVKQLYQA